MSEARKIVPIVTVQNRYSFADREYDYVVSYCEKEGIGFMPWGPLGQVRLANEVLKRVAGELGLTEMQVGLAWLLRRAKVMLPIPGTSSVKHVEENVAAAGMVLPEGVFEELSRVSPPPASLRG